MLVSVSKPAAVETSVAVDLGTEKRTSTFRRVIRAARPLAEPAATSGFGGVYGRGSSGSGCGGDGGGSNSGTSGRGLEHGDGQSILMVGHRGRGAGDVVLLSGRGSGVHALAVPAQVHLPLERPVAQAAWEWPVARVFAQVRDQVGRLAERLLAYHALVRFLT